MTEQSLTLKYRPKVWKDVVGQAPVVRSFQDVIAKQSNRTFLLSGPSGTGKTTLARIAAKEVGVEEPQELNAASTRGIDDMRQIVAALQFKPFGASKVRALILDECHKLSPDAWTSLLKPLEEPPKDVWWFLCTTDLIKVPAAAQTRCTRYDLKPVSRKVLFEMLQRIAEAEKFRIGQDDAEQEDILELCARSAQGSPRMAITNLGACAQARDIREAEDLLQQVGDSSAAIDLARALMSGAKWHALSAILDGLRAENPESVRHVVRAYMTNVLLGNGKGGAEKHMRILAAFSQPFSSTDGVSPLVLACGSIAFGSFRD